MRPFILCLAVLSALVVADARAALASMPIGVAHPEDMQAFRKELTAEAALRQRLKEWEKSNPRFYRQYIRKMVIAEQKAAKDQIYKANKARRRMPVVAMPAPVPPKPPGGIGTVGGIGKVGATQKKSQ